MLSAGSVLLSATGEDRAVVTAAAQTITLAMCVFSIVTDAVTVFTPTDYGSWAILSIFLAILLPVVDSGFSQALIRKKEIKDGDYSSVFYVNVLIAIVL